MSAVECASEAGRAEQANKWAVRANGQAGSPVLTSGFFIILAHSGGTAKR